MSDKTNSYKWLSQNCDRLLAWEYFRMEVFCLFKDDCENLKGIDDDDICDKVGFDRKHFKYNILSPAIKKIYNIYERRR